MNARRSRSRADGHRCRRGGNVDGWRKDAIFLEDGRKQTKKGDFDFEPSVPETLTWHNFKSRGQAR